MKKQYGISTELQYVNLEEVLKNYTDRKFWKKSWCVFKTKDFSCFWKMKTIDVDNNKIESVVSLEYCGKHRIINYFWDNHKVVNYCSSIPISNSDYTQVHFNKNILGAIEGCINELEIRIIKNSYEYRQAEQLERDEVKTLREIAENFLDRENVQNQDIRCAYIDSYISKASRYSYTSKVESTAYRRYYPTARLMLFSWFDNKKKFEEEAIFLKQSKGLKKKFAYEIWKCRKELKGDDFVAEAEDMLEGI